MKNNQTFTAFAPASIGNFSLGFDVLGAAIAPLDGQALGDCVSACPADTYSLQVKGRQAHVVPADASENLVTRAYLLYINTLTEKGLASQPLALTLHKNLPVASGLGSSAASIVAALVAINHAHNQALSTQELLELAAQLEGSVSGSPHYDNVAPSLLGGLQLMTGQAQSPALALPFPLHWLMVVSFPGTAVSTHQARKALPTALPIEDTIAFGRNLANFVHHLHTGNHRAAAAYVEDPIALPHRLPLLPGFAEYAKHAKAAGAQAVGISGSGPTVFALCETMATARTLQKLALEGYCANPDEDKSAFSHICQLDTEGARLL
jgi:homoserine kinase